MGMFKAAAEAGVDEGKAKAEKAPKGERKKNYTELHREQSVSSGKSVGAVAGGLLGAGAGALAAHLSKPRSLGAGAALPIAGLLGGGVGGYHLGGMFGNRVHESAVRDIAESPETHRDQLDSLFSRPGLQGALMVPADAVLGANLGALTGAALGSRRLAALGALGGAGALGYMGYREGHRNASNNNNFIREQLGMDPVE